MTTPASTQMRTALAMFSASGMRVRRSLCLRVLKIASRDINRPVDVRGNPWDVEPRVPQASILRMRKAAHAA